MAYRFPFSCHLFVFLLTVFLTSSIVKANSRFAYSRPKEKHQSLLFDLNRRFMRIPDLDAMSRFLVRKQPAKKNRRPQHPPVPTLGNVGPQPWKSSSPFLDADNLPFDTLHSIDPDEEFPQASTDGNEEGVQIEGNNPSPSSTSTPSVMLSATSSPSPMWSISNPLSMSPLPRQTRSRRPPRKTPRPPTRSSKPTVTPSVSILPSRSPKHRRKRPSRKPTQTPTPSTSAAVQSSVTPSASTTPSMSFAVLISLSPLPSPSLSPSVTATTSVSSSSTISQTVSPTLTPTTSTYPTTSTSLTITTSTTPSYTHAGTASSTSSPKLSVSPTLTPSVSFLTSMSPTATLTASLTSSISPTTTASVSSSGSQTASSRSSPSETVIVPTMSSSPLPSFTAIGIPNPSGSHSASLSAGVSKSSTSAPYSNLPSFTFSPSASQEFTISPSMLPSASEIISPTSASFPPLTPSESHALSKSEGPPGGGLPTFDPDTSEEWKESPNPQISVLESNEPVVSLENEPGRPSPIAWDVSPTSDLFPSAESLSPSTSFGFTSLAPSTEHTPKESPNLEETWEPSTSLVGSTNYDEGQEDKSHSPGLSMEPSNVPSLYPIPSSGGDLISDQNDPSISPKAVSSLNPAQQEVTAGPSPSAPLTTTQSPVSSDTIVIIPPVTTATSPPEISAETPTPSGGLASPSSQATVIQSPFSPTESASVTAVVSAPPIPNGPAVSPIASNANPPAASPNPSTVTDGDSIIVQSSYSPTGEANATESPVNQPPELVNEPDGAESDIIEDGNGSSNSTLSDGEGEAPSIVTGQWREKMGTGLAGRAFPIIMGILGALLVLALIICLVMSVLGAPPASYSYDSKYTGEGARPSDYGSTQGGEYTDQGGLNEGGGNYGVENFSDGYGPNSLGNAPQSGGYSAEPGTYNTQYTGASPLAPDVAYEGNLTGRGVDSLAGGNKDAFAAEVSVDRSAPTGFEYEDGYLHNGTNLEQDAEGYPYPHPYGEAYGSAIEEQTLAQSPNGNEYGEYTRDTNRSDDYDFVHHGNQSAGSSDGANSEAVDTNNARPGRSVQFADETMNQRLSALASVANGPGGTVGLVDRGDYYYSTGQRAVASTPVECDGSVDFAYGSSRYDYENEDVCSPLQEERHDMFQDNVNTYGDRESCEAPPLYLDQYSGNSGMSGEEVLDDENVGDDVKVATEDESRGWSEEQNNVDEEKLETDVYDDMKENSVPTDSMNGEGYKHSTENHTHKQEPGVAYMTENEAGNPAMFGERLVLGDSDWQRISQRENRNDGRKIPNPEYDYLRKLREPYVKSVAGRLSTDALSCTTAVPPEGPLDTGVV